MATLTALVSAASAYAKPSMALLDPSARSGDVVHFTITGAPPSVSYGLSVDHDWVQDGTGVLGTFTVPDLGERARSVDVEIAISGPGKTRTVEQELDYLGRAHAAPSPPVAAVPGPVDTEPAPAAAPQTASGPAPAVSSVQSLVHAGPAPVAVSPKTGPLHASRKPAVKRPPRQTRQRVHRAHARHGRHATARRHRTRHTRAGAHHRRHARRRIVCPCRFGHPSTVHAVKPGGHVTRGVPEPTTAAPVVKKVPVGGGGLTAAAFVPGLAAAAGLALGATALARRRRLGSRLGRS